MQKISDTDVWRQLADHHRHLGVENLHIKDLFAQDPNRVKHLTLRADTLVADLSRHLMTAETWQLLHSLADQAKLSTHIQAMFDGEAINRTEQRPALHVALRGHSPAKLPDAAAQVESVLARMEALVEAVHSGTWCGHDGQRITDVVNIGIGGSDLGPAMATAALRPWHRSGIRAHFVSNLDPAHLQDCLQHLNPATTLFVVASKSFSTLETLQNAHAARRWCLAAGVEEQALHKHFVAVSTNVDAAVAFGIAADNIYPMWDWVGGRFSLWSSIGLSIALATDMPCFFELLAGAHAMDMHFRDTPAEQNLPIKLGLLSIWYRNFCRLNSHAILPYAQDLHLLPAYLQQLDMESLGKSVDLNGQPSQQDTGAIVWGSAGTNGQHSFHQLLHQGTQVVPAEFLAIARAASPGSARDDEQHQHLLANCLSQSRALMCGKTRAQARAELLAAGHDARHAEDLSAHQVVPGNRPSTTILVERLTPYNLGSLLALYEHRVFVQSIIWNINAFDQWGVTLGKQLSHRVFQALSGDPLADADMDPSTRALIDRCRGWR